MTIRVASVLVAIGLAMAANPASAGLLGSGKTAQALFYPGALSSPQGEIPVGGMDFSPVPLVTPIDYQNRFGEAIHIADTQIVITNLVSGAPFCLAIAGVGNACTDEIDGFDFKFTGENIIGVSADFASAPGFLPVTGTFQGHTHLGLQLISNNEIRVDVTGDLPLLNDQLILDLSFIPPVTAAPEPAALALLGSALAGLTALRTRCKL